MKQPLRGRHDVLMDTHAHKRTHKHERTHTNTCTQTHAHKHVHVAGGAARREVVPRGRSGHSEAVTNYVTSVAEGFSASIVVYCANQKRNRNPESGSVPLFVCVHIWVRVCVGYV